MAERMAAKGVTAQQHYVEGEHYRTDPKTEMPGARCVSEPKPAPSVMRQNQNKDDRDVEKVPMDILQDQRKRGFPWVPKPRFTDRTSRRIGPERLVIRASII